MHQGQEIYIFQLVALQNQLVHLVGIDNEVSQFFDPIRAALDRNVAKAKLNKRLTMAESLQNISELIAHLDRIKVERCQIGCLLQKVDED